MIEAIIDWSVRRRWLVLLVAGLVAAGGAWAVIETPVDAIPDLSETQVLAYVDWPGHPPQEVEEQITQRLCLRMGNVPGVRTVRGSSEFNYALIHIIFDDGVAIASARRSLLERMEELQAELPTGATARLAPDAPATGQIFWYTVEGGGLDLGELRALQDWRIKPQLANVAGVAEVASVGGFSTEIAIRIDPLKLAAAGLTVGDVTTELSQSAATAGGQVLSTPTGEFLVRSSSNLGKTPAGEFSLAQAAADLKTLVVSAAGRSVPLEAIAEVSAAPAARRGVLEKDGSEVVGGVVLMRYGENPLAVIRRLKDKILALEPSLPERVRIVIGYDRTPLIASAVGTVTSTLLEAIAIATLCVLLILKHFRTSLVIALALPLSVLGCFLALWALRSSGAIDVQTNIMSLAGLAISIGVLVDSSIVMADNVMHRLRDEFGDSPVQGDVTDIVVSACQQVGRPIFFSVFIMLLSFLPVLTLGGLEGKMFRPLALTKSLALLGAAVLAITFVPALCTLFIRGRMRGERESGIVRGLADVYLPTLRYLMERPAALLWVTGAIFILGLAPLGWRWHGYPWPILGALSLFGGMIWLQTPSRLARGVAISTLLLVALFADRNIQPLESEFLSPLDEGTVMDMPITVPAISITQAADDLKARDMVLCRFPEVEMVMGKVGRAETPTDPAPVDMIETMVSFHPSDFWPRRSLASRDAMRVIERVYVELAGRKLIEPAEGEEARLALLANCQEGTDPKFDLVMREVAYQRNQELIRSLGNELAIAAARSALAQLRQQRAIASTAGEGEAALIASRFPPDLLAALGQSVAETDARRCERIALAVLRDQKLLDESASPELDLLSPLVTRRREIWKEHLRKVDADLQSRAPGALVHLALEDLTSRCKPLDRELADEVERLRAFRLTPPKASRASGGHHGSGARPLTRFEPAPVLDGLQQQLADEFASSLPLARKARKELVGFGGELDQAVQMPGWTNVWTMPIQNRVDMLATGVNSTIGIRVLGERLEDVLTASDAIAEILRQVPGATQVVADPVRGKGYLDIELDRRAAGKLGVSIADANDVIQAALGGKVAGHLDADRRRFDLRVSFPTLATEDLDAVGRLPVPRQAVGSGAPVALGEIATVRFSEGPASIKSEKGVLRNYVRANVRERDVLEFLQEAQQVVEQRAQLPPGVFVEWTGQFEHQLRARQRLWIVGPCVLLIILSILYFTYRDWMDALLVVPAVAGALAGGLFLQWLLGFGMSVTVAVGFLACFGMAAATGIIMLVYLRDAVERAGGLANISLAELREAVLEGAVHRLRPKLLTEATTILGLAPMLWASGVGAEVIRPMAAPVLGGILIADEVIDLLLPVAFYWVRRARWQRLHGESGGRDLVTSDEAPDVSAA